MIVKCISNKLEKKDFEKYSESRVYQESEYHFVIGKSYLVYGITIKSKYLILQIYDDCAHLVFAPLDIFEIIDARVSKYWEVRVNTTDNYTALWPKIFYKEYFHDDLAEGLLEITESFNEVCKMLEEEFNLE